MQLSEGSLLLEKDKTNNLSLIFSIICIIDVFGVFPVITLPKVVIACGFYGILVIVVVCSTQIYTAILLGRCWIMAEEINPSIRRKNRYPYSALAELTYGRVFANFISFLVDVTIFGGGIPNLIVAAQNLDLLGSRISNNNFDLSFCFWIIIIGMVLCPILWMGSPKDMKLLCAISVTIVVLVFLLVVGSLVRSSVLVPEEVEPKLSLWEAIFTFYGILTFQYDIHPSILTIQVDMKEKSKLGLAVLLGFLSKALPLVADLLCAVSVAMFSLTSILVVVKGSKIQPSVLETLPAGVAVHFAALLVALQLCLSSAVGNSALYQHVEDCMSIPRGFNHRRCVLRTTLTLLAVLIAEAVPRFDLVMSLIGGALTGPLIFIFPPLFYLRILVLKSRNGGIGISSVRKLEIVFCGLVILLSVVATGVTTYVNLNGAMRFANFSQPCIYNVTDFLLKL